jgi:hypothetical protein
MPEIVILISGKARSGKNTIAEFMEHCFHGRGKTVSIESIAQAMKTRTRADFTKLSQFLNNIADEIETSVSVMGDLSRDQASQRYYDSLTKSLDKIRTKESNWLDNKTELTRMLMQIYGTEIFQYRVDKNYWDRILKNRILESDKQVILVTDVRFPSNIDELGDSDKYKTFTIRINRNVPLIDHPTETSLDAYKQWNYIVDNNGNLNDLRASATKIVEDIMKPNKCEGNVWQPQN